MSTPSELQKQIRLQCLLWAYAYEIHGEHLVSDEVFDRKVKAVDLDIPTDDPSADAWFRKHFSPHTGQWVHKHPNHPYLEALYRRIQMLKNRKVVL